LLFVSDQQAGELRVFAVPDGATPSYHGRIRYSASETDGIDLTATPLPGFPGGLLVAMSDDRTYHFYDLDDLLRALQR
jgi:3-phytase